MSYRAFHEWGFRGGRPRPFVAPALRELLKGAEVIQYACEHEQHEGSRLIPAGRERFQISGFEAEREAGGTNHVELRVRTGLVWCEDCVEFEKLGGQRKML